MFNNRAEPKSTKKTLILIEPKSRARANFFDDKCELAYSFPIVPLRMSDSISRKIIKIYF